MGIEQVVSMIIGGLFSGVIIYIVKGFFTGIEERLKRTEDSLNGKINNLELKVNQLSDKYGLVFNEILTKFSSWEDRIKNILDSYVKNSQSGLSNDDAKRFEALIKKEIKNISDDVVEIENKIKEFESGVKIIESKGNSFGVVLNSLNSSLSSIRLSVDKIKSKVDKIESDNSLKLETLFKICKSISFENKKLSKRIDSLSESSKNKIVLK